MYGQLARLRLPTEIQRYYEGALWSGYYYADATALANRSDEVFVTPEGSQGQGWPAALSIAETNMKESGKMPAGLAFTTRQIALEPEYVDTWEVARADMQNFQANMVGVWFWLNTEVEVSTAMLIGQGGGKFGSTADTGAAEGGAGGSRFYIANGAGQTFVYYELPVLLNANTTFRFKFKWGRNAVAVDGGRNNSALAIKCHLIGVVTSAVPTG